LRYKPTNQNGKPLASRYFFYNNRELQIPVNAIIKPLDCHSERSEESQGKLREGSQKIGFNRDSSLRSE